MAEKKKLDRRDFIRNAAGVAFAGTMYLAADHSASASIWQLDPTVCTRCGRCATHCTLNPSAVKCVNAYDICGYCDLCGGYLWPGAKERNTAAENQLCPTAAIQRKFIEDPYYEYIIDEERCIGCSKCVEACEVFGNGSFYLQIKHDSCVNCNECSIAVACPVDAFRRIPEEQEYLLKTREAAEAMLE